MGVRLPSQEQICAQEAPATHPRPLIGEKNRFIRAGECLLKLGKVNIRMVRSLNNSKWIKSAAGVALISALLLPAIFESSSALAAPKAVAKATTKKAPVAKKAVAKKAVAKKVAVKKTPVKKALVKKAPVKKVVATKKVAVTKKAKAVPAVVAPAVAPIDPTTADGVVEGVKAAKVAKANKATKVKDPSEAKPRGLRRLKMLLP